MSAASVPEGSAYDAPDESTETPVGKTSGRQSRDASLSKSAAIRHTLERQGVPDSDGGELTTPTHQSDLARYEQQNGIVRPKALQRSMSSQRSTDPLASPSADPPSRPPSTYFEHLDGSAHQAQLDRSASRRASTVSVSSDAKPDVSSGLTKSALNSPRFERAVSSSSDSSRSTGLSQSSPLLSAQAPNDSHDDTLSPYEEGEASNSVLTLSAPARAIPVRIRDFAFPSDDPRYVGKPHPDMIEHERRRAAAAQAGSSDFPSMDLSSRLPEEALAEDSDEEAAGEEARRSGASPGAFYWGFTTSADKAQGDEAFYRPRYKLDSNSSQADDDELDSHSEPLEGQESEELPAIEPGSLYKANYAFTAETPQEMSLIEGEIVKVYERLCEGWVIAAKMTPAGDESSSASMGSTKEEAEEEQGLIPESYLTLVG
ncbi:uncharacterized protein L969DRAFT_67891 [Mixia osmundae IAM 14324]|uniref:SH3 domain-containing protein n=1 Tax=Mixia osmundae (strain CBS 9802 / IAM 14324 / JCM 22182 / KY 12970) TaxID=764103 RepID=G7DUJ8_MIXOS|nr:uncharacterized protein L969DRAFT_67891 [Mixia osmundae IAM 14324]KEI36407.1 hypothetical protein L969DRAFT_67891 [Mixia osmundae IAM 14324]GAA94258.1 hypothetical protein E5Q_00907 [Mixia osmundae IAM 14324]